MNKQKIALIERINRINILLRRINVNIKNIDDSCTCLKLYNTENRDLFEKIMSIEENFIDTTDEIRKLEKAIWAFI